MNAIIPAEPSNGALISFIERASRDTDFDVQKFGELLKLQRDIEHDRARRAFNVAMSEAQTEMLPVVRDAKNDHLRNKYAKLETIDNAIRPIYTRHGFSVRYGSAPAPVEGNIRITCTVAHSGGYYEESYLDSPTGNAGSQGGRTATTPVQAVGSAVTYLRRYLLSMVFNVVLADEDDDGEGMRRRAPDTRASVESAPPPTRKPSVGEWFDALEADLVAAPDSVAVDAIIARPDVQKALDAFTNGARARLNAMVKAAIDRTAVAAPDGAGDGWPGPTP